MRTIIYTAIYGNYDTIKGQPVEVKVITDIERPEDHPRMKAKYFKCNPHEFLDCDVSIWIDGSAQIFDSNFTERVLDYLGDSDLMAFKHPDRDNIYDEAVFCRHMEKYADQDVMGQVNSYDNPKESGLWACGMIVRRHNKRVKKFNKLWWEHNLKYTYQDQLSFPICVKESGVKLKTPELNLWNNDLISFNNAHASSK